MKLRIQKFLAGFWQRDLQTGWHFFLASMFFVLGSIFAFNIGFEIFGIMGFVFGLVIMPAGYLKHKIESRN